MGVSVGIDLGTTYCAVAYVPRGAQAPQIVVNSEQKRLTPSIIQFEGNERIFGSEAEEAFREGEQNCAAAFKRHMSSSEPCFYLDGREFTAEELSSMLLEHLKQDAEETLGQKITEAVITVPAYFQSIPREATIRAAEKAGLKVKKLLDEPNAAALAYGVSHWRKNALILVYDLGGGTFDVSLVKMMGNGELQTIATRGNDQLGGKNWDTCLKDLLLRKYSDELDRSLEDDPEAVATVIGIAETTKQKLTTMSKTPVKCYFRGSGNVTVTVSREEFDEVTYSLLSETGDLCRGVLADVGVSASDVTDVLLIGGSTRMPQVAEYLEQLFGKRPLQSVNQDEAVALGAAIQATKLDDTYVTPVFVKDEKGKKKMVVPMLDDDLTRPVEPEHSIDDLSDISIRETTAFALGIVSVDDEKNCFYNEVIIPANHSRPVRFAKRFRFFTSKKQANEMEIYVLQGDDPSPANCTIPHKYVVSGIRHVKEGDTVGTTIRVQYSYDTNGIIRIQARQEDDKKDLPIRQERVTVDRSVFSRPVKQQDPAAALADDGETSLMTSFSRIGNVAHKYRSITFSNVEWDPFDRVLFHESAPAEYREPREHVIADNKKITFRGYNVSSMNEGVKYTIQPGSEFKIECDIDTSNIKPHPGGHLNIKLGLIAAALDENGGRIVLDGRDAATVPSRFHLMMSLTENGKYSVEIDKRNVGSAFKQMRGPVDVEFSFEHDSHYCNLRSDAFISDIDMTQMDNAADDDVEVPTWND